MIDVDAYLRRIGHTGPVAPTLDTLRAVHRAQLLAVPYENAGIQLGTPAPLDIPALEDRIVRQRAGGYCYQLNGLFGALLTALGFQVRHACAAVHLDRYGEEDGWGNHLALLVDLDGQTWVADAGLGDGFLDPLPLRPGVHHQGAERYTIEDRGDRWWIGLDGRTSPPGYHLRTAPLELADFDAWHQRLSTAEDSPFVRTFVVQRMYADRTETVRALTHTVRTATGNSTATLDRPAFEATVARLGVPEEEGLWGLAAAQQEAWVAAGSP
ncbi:arylamine N-acetyltransferase [Longispora fulva]|uniref:N-hydroxyarylamine O-acetyltransferase n=1 Tax=Longispora fulva TaxID=619741 RepID=A0A8J7GMX7_9ACTN|nr:arylamine N-acetyltransferase [Longispora fulva]MBG6139987.1 N-hydroxyarylamine O-acetyltransferase [Longispora fulva]GIG57634.1 arylamine N-acetyltransferase [Longispora fulva]